MNPRETAFFGLAAAVFSIVFCGLLMRVPGHAAQLSSVQASHGLTICLAGVVVGLLLVLCVSALQEAQSGWDRSLGALGLALGCMLLFALLLGQRLPHAQAITQTLHQGASESSALLLAPGTSR